MTTNSIICFLILKSRFLNKIFVLWIILLFIVTSYSAAFAQNPTTKITLSKIGRDIIWDVTISYQEPGGGYDYTVFGEATDAFDGPPVDMYDTMKPPPPMSPYLYSWFNNGLPAPYDKLTKDFRHYPDITKRWILSVQWVPSDYVTPTTVTMKWDSIAINSTEYTFIILADGEDKPLKNMRLCKSYSFSCPAMEPQKFNIICFMNHPPYKPSNPFPFNGSTEIPVNTELRWTSGDPDYGDTVTYDVYYGTQLPLIKITANQSGTCLTIGPLLYNTKYYWKIVAWDAHQTSTASPLWWFTSKTDSTPPTVTITQPHKGFLYVNIADIITRKFPIFITTFIVGKIDVTVDAVDSLSGINRVEFYIDDVLKATDTTAPYSWAWLERGYFFPYILRVKAFDCVGIEQSTEIRAWKIL